MEQISVWFYETSKKSFRHALTDSNVIVVPSSLLRLSTCLEPPSVSPRIYQRQYTNTMADCHGMLEKGWAVLQECMDDLFLQLGTGYGNPRRPTELDIYEKMVEKRKQKSSISFEEKEALSRWIIKLAPFKNYMEQFGSDKSLDLARLIKENVIFELTEFSRSTQGHVISALELWTLVYKQQNPEAANITNVRIIDEAMNLVAEDKIGLGRSFIFRTGIKLGRQYRLFYLLGTQQAQALKDVLDLAQAVVIMQQSDFALPFFHRNMLMTRNQPNHLKNIPVGRGVVATPERPLTEITVPFHEISAHRSDEEIEREMKPILEGFLIDSPRAKYEPETVIHTEQDLWHEKVTEVSMLPDEMKKAKDLAKYLAENPLAGVSKALNDNDLGIEFGYRILGLLQKLKCIEGPVNVPSGGSGNNKKIWVLTFEGAKFAGLDWDKVRLRGKGGLTSKVYVKIIYDHLKKQGRTPEFEYSLKVGSLRKQCDVGDLDTGTGFEFENTLTSHIITNIQKNDAIGLKTVVVCKNKAEKKKIDQYLLENLPPNYWNRAEVQTIKEFL
jgi:hypothetical protein